MANKVWLSPEQERAVRDAYSRGCTSAEVAFLADVSVSLLYARMSDQVADVRKGRGRGGRRGNELIPTLEEIERRKQECLDRRLRILKPKFYSSTNLD